MSPSATAALAAYDRAPWEGVRSAVRSVTGSKDTAVEAEVQAVVWARMAADLHGTMAKERAAWEAAHPQVVAETARGVRLLRATTALDAACRAADVESYRETLGDRIATDDTSLGCHWTTGRRRPSQWDAAVDRLMDAPDEEWPETAAALVAEIGGFR